MASDREREIMALAIAEARRGRTSPNPRVGAVLVRDGAILATGFHERAGAPHAEVDAMSKATGSLKDATLYVTLEPCNHHGRTGPCTEAIVDAGIGRVVIGARDPAPHVPGAIDSLRSAGVHVELGLLEEECTELIADFAKHIRTGLPLVTLKAAITLDGKIATRSGDSKWITGKAARTEAHRLRANTDAVLVGVSTVLSDDPALTVRHVEGRDPLRVVLDADLRTPSSAAVLDPAGASEASTLILHADDLPSVAREALGGSGVELVGVPRDRRGVDLTAVLELLGARDVMSLLVEGGARVHGSFLDLSLADRAALFIAPKILGSAAAPSFAAGEDIASISDAKHLVRTRMQWFDPDWLITGDFERTL